MSKLIITEEQIEECIQDLDASEEAFSEAVENFKTRQPVLFAFFFSEGLQILTQVEKEYLFYLAVMHWKAIYDNSNQALPQITEEQLGKAEERNWELLDGVKSKEFRERLNVFFEDSDQEDLLAFAEDMLTLEDQDELTEEGREPMFIALKSMVDCLLPE